MAQNQQTNTNTPNYPYMYQNQNFYSYNPYFQQYNAYSTQITQQGKLDKIDTSTPPPPGVTNFSTQPSPPGTTLTAQVPLQSYYSYPPPYQYQNYYTQNNYNIYQTVQPPPPFNKQPPPPPTYPQQAPPLPQKIPDPPGININNNQNQNSLNNTKPYNQIKYNFNSTTDINKEKDTQDTFKPDYIAVSPTNNTESNIKKEEMAKKDNNKKNEDFQYPQSLKDYITRMFKICPLDKRDVLEEELKKLIADAQLRNVLFTVKWENMGLPTKCLETSKPVENSTISLNLQINNVNKKRKRLIDTSSASSSPYSSQLSSSVEMDESLMKLPEKERIEEKKRRERRAKRFNDDYNAEMKKRQEKELLNRKAEIDKQRYIEQNGNPNVVDWDQYTIVGTCQDLEKNYLRLTSAPDPSTIRPLPVLHKTLELLKRKWTEEQNYNYICDQFKSLRQDLTVQRIKNDFAVEVYEIHARIALEKGDLGEYNQCQSQLKQLYKLGFNGHEMEFTAYRLLYYVHTLNPTDINTLISELTPEQKEHEFIKHALDVRTAVANGNYHKFFYLYLNPPHNMACYLMDHFVERERIKALKAMTKAYLSLNVTFITEELGFDNEEECLKLLKSLNCPIKKEKGQGYVISGKATYSIFNRKYQDITKRGIDIKGQI